MVVINDLRQFIVSGDAEATKNKISNYLINDRGYPANLVSITVRADDATKGELLEYPAAGSYDKTSSTLTIVISGGPQ